MPKQTPVAQLPEGVDRLLEVDYNGKWYEFVTRIEPGYDVTVTDKIVIREIFVDNVYQVVEGDLDDTGIVIDIGGNIGAFSMYAAALGAKKVLTYEPDNFNWPILKANIERNGMGDIITPYKNGVLDKGKTVKLVNGQGASFVEGEKTIPTPEAQRIVDEGNVPSQDIVCISLASVFADNKVSSCDLLKMDVEGSEYRIFEGATPEIIAKARYITMEFHATSAEEFGLLISKLSMTHNIHIIGKHDLGGQIYAKRY